MKILQAVPCCIGHRTLLNPILGAVFWASLLVSALAQERLLPEQVEFFESKIRPVLAQECYECHNSRGKSKSGLILDHRDALRKGGDAGSAIVPGNPAQSLLISALKHEDDLAMPKAGVKLDPPIIADFEKWIAMGAPDPRDDPPSDKELAADTNWEAIFQTRRNWWSFQPVTHPKVPEGKGSAIDRFLARKLRQKELHFSPPAEPRVLARRLYHTLIGLPPKPEELDQFIRGAETNLDQATARLIDDLLSRPQFGERWARHWMDWVRYAESHGSEGDPAIPNAWQYRDYLIRALNNDVGYDEMLREHIAGDLLPEPRFSKNGDAVINESVLGAIHWRMVFHGFAPTDALDEKVRFTDDQINTFTKAFQGLTVSCARCHDHKFDAISQADYFALFGILGSTRPGVRLADHPTELEKNKTELADLKSQIRSAVAQRWLAEQPQHIFKRLHSNFDAAAGKAKEVESLYYLFFELKNRGSIQHAVERLRNDWNFSSDGVVREWDLSDPEIYGEKWHRYGNGLPDKPQRAGDFLLHPHGESKNVIEAIFPSGVFANALSTKHAARLSSEEFLLDDKYTLHLQAFGNGGARTRYVVQNYPRKGTVYKVTDLPGKKPRPKGIPRPRPGEWIQYPLDFWEGDRVHIELSTGKDSAVLSGGKERSWFGIRRAFLTRHGSPNPNRTYSAEFLKPVLAELRSDLPENATQMAALFDQALRKAILSWRAGSINDTQALLLDRALEEGLLPNSLKAMGGDVQGLVKRYRDLEKEIIVPSRVPGLDEWTGRDQPLFERGNHKKPLAPVARRFLETVESRPYSSSQSGRLELATDLLKKENSFTRRVIVNRIWTHLFGNGIVASVDNFGRLGEKPSHPGLLDYLAARFEYDHAWSIKSLIREIVSSAAWRQSSHSSPRAREIDPGNRLLSHFPIRRLEAEAIRDKLLAVSGLLDNRMRGPGDNGKGRRRSVYVQVIRNRLDPFLAVFDAPIPFSTTGKRPVTNVPAQSLTMLNDPMIAEFAEALANRFSGSGEERITAMWRVALGRLPSEAEMRSSQLFLERLREENRRLTRQTELLQTKIDQAAAANSAIAAPVRERLLDGRSADAKSSVPSSDLRFVAGWDFREGTIDVTGGLTGKLTGSAQQTAEGLVLDGKSSFFSVPLKSELSEKTLEALVTVGRLDQRGGGVLTCQDTRGVVFDSIVFGEKEPAKWLAGSDHHRRTLSFSGAPRETETAQPVHLAIAYEKDGTIRAYRNGQLYGKEYRSNGPVVFRPGNWKIVAGLRHGQGNGGNRNFSGVIHQIRVYGRTLRADEISQLAAGQKFVSESQLIEALTESQRKTYRENKRSIEEWRRQLSELQKGRSSDVEQSIWRNYAHSLFNLKEFIYLY